MQTMLPYTFCFVLMFFDGPLMVGFQAQMFNGELGNPREQTARMHAPKHASVLDGEARFQK